MQKLHVNYAFSLSCFFPSNFFQKLVHHSFFPVSKYQTGFIQLFTCFILFSFILRRAAAYPSCYQVRGGATPGQVYKSITGLYEDNTSCTCKLTPTENSESPVESA